MKISEIKAEALKILSGKWSVPVVIILLETVIMMVAQGLSGISGGILGIAITICQIPISYGLIMSFMKIKRGEEVEVIQFFKDGFANFGRSWGVVGNTLLKLLPWLITYIASAVIMIIGIALIAVGGADENIPVMIIGIILTIIMIVLLYVSLIFLIMKEYLYYLANYIAIDNPEMSTKDAVAKSAELMMGKRVKLFGLQVSFIGWSILCLFTLGIGFLWLASYMSISEVVFYDDIIGKKENEVEVITENK